MSPTSRATRKNMSTKADQQRLLQWYLANRRELPWRQNRNPYRIWISETMLQQTTTTAVIPFFERFVERFPTLASLAAAKVEAVVAAWAGLGYYSRARNLHKSALALHAHGGFPRSHVELSQLPGFGPYTSRSVASLAFGENVGVVDGNVIRVLARFEGRDWEWWKPKIRDQVQVRADAWVSGVLSQDMNQALMELGRTICMPKSPACPLCPLRLSCLSLKQDAVALRPLPKPRRARETWAWEPELALKGGKILIRRNSQAPFLRGQWLLPGPARPLKKKPARFDYRHSITHHDIFVTVSLGVRTIQSDDKWIPLDELRHYIPASLVEKALAHAPGGIGAATRDVQTSAAAHSPVARKHRRRSANPRR